MKTELIEDWINDFHKERGWNGKNPDKLLGYMIEEVGEVARAIRALDGRRAEERLEDSGKDYETLRAELAEELGDVLDTLVTIGDYYDIDLDTMFGMYQHKMIKRYKNG